jgi:hypothetical protein
MLSPARLPWQARFADSAQCRRPQAAAAVCVRKALDASSVALVVVVVLLLHTMIA